MTETVRVSFSVEGEWFTDFARERYYQEGVGYPNVEKALLSGMLSTEFTEDTLKRMAQDILMGRAKMTGNTRDKTYTYQELSGSDNLLIAYADRMRRERDEARHALRHHQEMWSELAQVTLGDMSLSDCECPENRELYNPSSVSQVVDDILSGAADAPYGFISPDGEFFEADWGHHSQWSEDRLREVGAWDAYKKATRETYKSTLDYLILDLGWLLLHNPTALCRPILSRSETRPMPKRQKEALYDYYVKYGLTTEANALYAGKDENDE